VGPGACRGASVATLQLRLSLRSIRRMNGWDGSCCQHSLDALYMDRSVEHPSAAQTRLRVYVREARLGAARRPRSATPSPARLSSACIGPSLCSSGRRSGTRGRPGTNPGRPRGTSFDLPNVVVSRRRSDTARR
jgi:hypothetical protein